MAGSRDRRVSRRWVVMGLSVVYDFLGATLHAASACLVLAMRRLDSEAGRAAIAEQWSTWIYLRCWYRIGLVVLQHPIVSRIPEPLGAVPFIQDAIVDTECFSLTHGL